MRSGEENSGLHLIKKHKKTLLRAVFSRAGLLVLLMLLQIALIVLAFSRLRDFLPHFVTVMTLFSTAMTFYLINSGHDPSAKLTWIIVILVLLSVFSDSILAILGPAISKLITWVVRIVAVIAALYGIGAIIRILRDR